MTIYRVQDKDGRGPWKPGFSHRWVEDRDDHDNLIAWPIELGNALAGRRNGMHVGCGCQTLEQLRRWFTASEYSTLLGLGYWAVQLEVNRVLAQSQTQCVFERSGPLRQGVVKIELYPVLEPDTSRVLAPPF